MIPLTGAENFSLRPMAKADIDRVYRIDTSTNLFPWSRDNLHTSLNGGDRCWVLEQNRQLAGYGITMVVANEGSILNLTIATNFQRQGLGQKLLDFLVEDIKQQGARIVFLEVRVSNKRAIGLYRNRDFFEIAVRNNYYPTADGREHALVMIKELTNE